MAGVGHVQVQQFVGRVAAAIHMADPDALVTVGGANLKWNYDGAHKWMDQDQKNYD